MEPQKHLILALDVPDRKEALRLVKLLRKEVGLFKVGWQLFMAEGPKFLLNLEEDVLYEFLIRYEY